MTSNNRGSSMSRMKKRHTHPPPLWCFLVHRSSQGRSTNQPLQSQSRSMEGVGTALASSKKRFIASPFCEHVQGVDVAAAARAPSRAALARYHEQRQSLYVRRLGFHTRTAH